MTESIIQFNDVKKTYEDKTVFQNLNIAIPRNRIIGILGPNGTGKSTFFRMITGLVRPDSGSISVLDNPPGWKTNRDIAYFPDRARWYPKHTVAQAFQWAENFLPGFQPENAKELADFMELDLEMKTSGMSRGQEARLMLILCMARNVSLIILDEPFSGIDILSREQIIEGIIDVLGDREQTILISTHEIHEIEGLFDYAVLLKEGGTLWSGDVEELRRHYGSMHDVFRKLYRKGLS